MTKKVLLLIGVLILVAIAVFLVLNERNQAESGGQTGFNFMNYFPFGQNNENPDISLDDYFQETDGNGGTNQPDTSAPAPQMRKVSNEPVAGAVAFNVGTSTLVRFVERGTGNVYEVRGESLGTRRLTNTTIPKIIRAFWLPSGNGFLAQTLVPESEIIETSLVELVENRATTSEVLTPFSTRISKLPTGIKELSISKDSKRILYYTVSNGADFYTADINGTNAKKILSHPLSEWLIKYWLSNSEVVIQTKESSLAPAVFYRLNLNNGSLSRLANPMVGVLAVSYTLIDKCALPTDQESYIYCAVPKQLESGNYPDDWYKGTKSTNDLIRKINTSNQIYFDLGNLSELGGEPVDVTDLKSSPNQEYLVFKNKIDGFLWLLRVEN